MSEEKGTPTPAQLQGYTNEAPSEEAVNAHHEGAHAEPSNPENDNLDHDSSHVVPTGDEEMPVGGAGDHKKSLKSIYNKSRTQREKVVTQEAEGNVDVAMVNAMVAEASGGDVPDEAEPEGFDTNRETRPELRGEDQGQPPQVEPDPQPPETTDPEPPASARDALPEYDPEDTVEVKVLGATYQVPRQDVDDAGGVAAYQKQRAANIRFQEAATLEKRARQQLEEQPVQQQADLPTPDGETADADREALREELLDTVANGSEEDIDSWIDKRIAARQQRQASPQPSTPPSEPPPTTEGEDSLERQWREEVAEANEMMNRDFPDIMGNVDLRVAATAEFNRIKTLPSSYGRTQSELAREAAGLVRKRQSAIDRNTAQPDPVEAERQTRIERKRAMPQTSRAAQVQAPNVTTERKVPSAKEHIARLRRKSGQDLTG